MPLKHATETLLVVLLGVVLALTGLCIAVLPTLPAGTVWWAIALACALLYPFALYPLLKSRRADYPFRVLHFAPFVLLLVRFLLDLGASFVSGLGNIARWYSWAWAAPAVLIVFALLMLFCVRVLRQRDTRLRLLAAVALPFIFFGVFTEQLGWNARVAGVLGDTPMIAGGPGTQTGANLDPSVDAAEERWRAMLRDREERARRLAGSGGLSGVAGLGHASRASSSRIASVATLSRPPVRPVTPPRLASSGPAMETAALFLAAGYCGVVHARARRRKR
jgi:hypothetical protein